MLLLLSCFLLQCQTAKQTRTERKQFKEVYINQFKLTYFRKLLLAGFNHSEAVKTLLRFDKSGFTEPVLSTEDLTLLDSLVYRQNRVMATDSANSLGRVTEGAEGKHVLGYVLHKMESKWLDSLANSRYKQSRRRKFSE